MRVKPVYITSQGKLFPISSYFQRSLLALREIDVTLASVKITQLPKLQEDSLVLSVQLETDEKGQKMNKKKKQELYHNLHNVSGIFIIIWWKTADWRVLLIMYPFTFYILITLIFCGLERRITLFILINNSLIQAVPVGSSPAQRGIIIEGNYVQFECQSQCQQMDQISNSFHFIAKLFPGILTFGTYIDWWRWNNESF